VLKELDNEMIEEEEFLKLNENYFEKVNIGKSEDESNTILEKVEKLKFSELSDFKLIEKYYPEVDVFIEVDDNAQSVWQDYKRITSIGDLKERKKSFLGIKKDFYDYVISVPEKFKNHVGFDEKLGIGHITKDEIEQGLKYNHETGFKGEDSGGGALFF